jgi:hypothetical protein
MLNTCAAHRTLYWTSRSPEKQSSTSRCVIKLKPFAELGLQNISLLLLQNRIRSLVYKIGKKHLQTLKAGRFEFVPEQQFMQYVLPCFVVFLLVLCNDRTASISMKQKFMRFVDKLINSYEQTEYVQLLPIEKKYHIQILRQDQGCKYIIHTDPLPIILFRFLSEFVKKNQRLLGTLMAYISNFKSHTCSRLLSNLRMKLLSTKIGLSKLICS